MHLFAATCNEAIDCSGAHTTCTNCCYKTVIASWPACYTPVHGYHFIIIHCWWRLIEVIKLLEYASKFYECMAVTLWQSDRAVSSLQLILENHMPAGGHFFICDWLCWSYSISKFSTLVNYLSSFFLLSPSYYSKHKRGVLALQKGSYSWSQYHLFEIL